MAHEDVHQLQYEDPAKILSFITGGHAFFTIKNAATENRFTYCVEAPKSKNPNYPIRTRENTDLLFVSLMTGTDNTGSYTYMGLLRLNRQTKLWSFEWGSKSKIKQDAASVVGFGRLFNEFFSVKRSLKPRFPTYEFWHEGRCCRCGKVLTVPESIISGEGPECAKIRRSHNQ